MNRGFGLVKYILVGLLVCFIGVLLLSGGSSKASIGDVEQAVVKAAPMEGLEKADEKAFKKIYGLNANDYEGVALYTSTSTMGVDEILVVKLKDNAQAGDLQASIEKRVETQLNNFDGYGVEQCQLLKDHVMKIKGNFVFFAVSPDATAIQKAFLKSL